mmetsp:Transcript_24492/g.37763  ORF Transcript_24492/g.37763 Transcript_24492/m.37763 type:complete len:98 (-) Transcript_24492:20-313(-)
MILDSYPTLTIAPVCDSRKPPQNMLRKTGLLADNSILDARTTSPSVPSKVTSKKSSSCSSLSRSEQMLKRYDPILKLILSNYEQNQTAARGFCNVVF